MPQYRSARASEFRPTLQSGNCECAVPAAVLWTFSGAALVCVLAVYSGHLQGIFATAAMVTIFLGGIGMLRACSRRS